MSSHDDVPPRLRSRAWFNNPSNPGMTALYLGRRRMAYIPGLSREDSEALLDRLWAYPAAEHRIYKHRWSVGDLVLWDNRTTMHRRDPFPADQRRLMHRTQIKGRAAPRAA